MGIFIIMVVVVVSWASKKYIKFYNLNMGNLLYGNYSSRKLEKKKRVSCWAKERTS